MSSVIDNDRASAFGRLVSAYDLEAAMVATVKRWIGDYLAEVERHHGLEVGAIPRPRAYVVSADTEKMPEDQLPAILIESPGLADEPQAYGDGRYWAPWTLNLSAHVAARGNRNALRIARLYAAALRLLAVQQQKDPVTNPLDMRRVDWIDERYGLLDSIDDRTICVGTVELRCEVAGVAQRNTGPIDPLMPPTPADETPPDASPEWPEAVTYDLDIRKEEFTPWVARPTPPAPTPGPDPDPGWGTLVGTWTWRTPGAMYDPFFQYSLCTDTDLPEATGLYVATQDIFSADRTADLLAIEPGAHVRVTYPADDDVPFEFEATFSVNAPPSFDDQNPVAQVAFFVTLVTASGDASHYGEDHGFRLNVDPPA